MDHGVKVGQQCLLQLEIDIHYHGNGIYCIVLCQQRPPWVLGQADALNNMACHPVLLTAGNTVESWCTHTTTLTGSIRPHTTAAQCVVGRS